jgi:hypothetical protein
MLLESNRVQSPPMVQTFAKMKIQAEPNPDRAWSSFHTFGNLGAAATESDNEAFFHHRPSMKNPPPPCSSVGITRVEIQEPFEA